jgi:hypothetical protein
MEQIALGYGSEFHLLRWLGSHRNEFDKRVKGLIQVDNISWLDFDFDENNPIPDKELKDYHSLIQILIVKFQI